MTTKNYENIQLLCRLCAEMYPKQILIQTDSEEFKSLNLAEKIYQYFIIDINENNIMPKDICTHCYEKVVGVYEFHQQIEKAQEKLNIIKIKLKIENCDDVKEEYPYVLYDNPPINDESDDDKPLSSLRPNSTSNKDSNNQTFLCDTCGKCYKTKYQLISHLKSHNDEKPFKCDECCKSFKNPAVRRHKLIHTGIKPFVCEICGKKFRFQGMLTMHSLMHTGVLPHECSYCKKRFRRIDFLKEHLRQHTGERPYSCTECNHFFSNGSNFAKHLKVRHRLQNVSITNRFQYPFK